MPINRWMLFDQNTCARPTPVHFSLLKANLFVIAASILFSVSVLAQEPSPLEAMKTDRHNIPLTMEIGERFGNKPDGFYNSAFSSISNEVAKNVVQPVEPVQDAADVATWVPPGQEAADLASWVPPVPETSNLTITSQAAEDVANFANQYQPVPHQPHADIQSHAQSMQASGTQSLVPETGNQPVYEAGPVAPTVPPIFAQPTNGQGISNHLLSPYQSRAASYRGNSALYSTTADNAFDPAVFRGWWAEQVISPVGIGKGHVEVSVDALIQNALRHSPHIQVAATASHILQTSVLEESAAFDWNSFLESQYVSENDPIGNTLTTGNNDDRFRQQEWFARGGVSRRTQTGGSLEAVQRLGYLDSNSRFLDPRNQGSARLELNFRQPILNGRGRAVNQSLIVLADIDFRSSSDDFLNELQLHLVTVTESYWELVRSRAVYLQRKRLLESAEEILRNLEGRSKVDSLQRQVLRAKAAVARRRSEIARSLTSIKNAQSQLRLLVNSPDISGSGGTEFTPMDLPMMEQLPVDIELADVMSTALMNRPDISRSIRDLHAANVRLGVARNDALPKLDMIVGTYLAGLDGDSDVFQSWAKQFKEGSPGFNVGFDYEFPLGNRAAKARQARRQWETTRSLHLFRQTVETSLTEVEVAAREVQTTHQEMLGRYHSMVAAKRESTYLVDRWQTLPEINDSVTLLLEDLLDSQERLADEESAFVNAQVQYSIAIVQLKQAMGTLFRVGH